MGRSERKGRRDRRAVRGSPSRRSSTTRASPTGSGPCAERGPRPRRRRARQGGRLRDRREDQGDQLHARLQLRGAAPDQLALRRGRRPRRGRRVSSSRTAGDGTNLATYALGSTPACRCRASSDVLSEQVMQGSMEDLKQRVEGCWPSGSNRSEAGDLRELLQPRPAGARTVYSCTRAGLRGANDLQLLRHRRRLDRAAVAPRCAAYSPGRGGASFGPGAARSGGRRRPAPPRFRAHSSGARLRPSGPRSTSRRATYGGARPARAGSAARKRRMHATTSVVPVEGTSGARRRAPGCPTSTHVRALLRRGPGRPPLALCVAARAWAARAPTAAPASVGRRWKAEQFGAGAQRRSWSRHGLAPRAGAAGWESARRALRDLPAGALRWYGAPPWLRVAQLEANKDRGAVLAEAKLRLRGVVRRHRPARSIAGELAGCDAWQGQEDLNERRAVEARARPRPPPPGLRRPLLRLLGFRDDGMSTPSSGAADASVAGGRPGAWRLAEPLRPWNSASRPARAWPGRRRAAQRRPESRRDRSATGRRGAASCNRRATRQRWPTRCGASLATPACARAGEALRPPCGGAGGRARPRRAALPPRCDARRDPGRVREAQGDRRLASEPPASAQPRSACWPSSRRRRL